ncbi:unnamed protein product [Linum trigynum]|uniref:Uncharacterized protein n=1 Tax=Linum trigynum TaxID=586398 RepID=A0AAV2CRR5_9ROSI
MTPSRLLTLFLSVALLALLRRPAAAQTTTVVRGGYWFPGSGFAASAINSTLFTHLFFAFAGVDSGTFRVNVSAANKPEFSTFTQTVQRANPSVKTLLSIGGGDANITTLAAMANQPGRRKAFIDSSISLARSYNFHGLDLDWQYPLDTTQMANFGDLLTGWKAAVAAEAESSGKPPLLLSAAVLYLSYYYSLSVPYPVQTMSNTLDWINLMAYDFYGPEWSPTTAGPPAALYNPGRRESGDSGVNSWIQSQFPANKIVLGIPFYGWSWRLSDSRNRGLFSPANGAGLAGDGSAGYDEINEFIAQNRATKVFDPTVISDYCYSGTTWIGYDDVRSVSTKVAYAKNRGLLGYYAWHVGADDNWTLSTAALTTQLSTTQTTTTQGDTTNVKSKKRGRLLLLYVLLPVILGLVFGCGMALLYRRKRRRSGRSSEFPSTGKGGSDAVSLFAGEIEDKNPRMVAVPYSFAQLEKATNDFSIENKVGQGGYGPVYKGVLADGGEIAVKKLSINSSQGDEEFKNEVMLTAQLQHVNLVRVLGYCIEGGERMLVYEYLHHKSLDHYLFDPMRSLMMDWARRVEIIEGVTQGLLYLQEYSGQSIIHRDLKPGNILLDSNMKPKISDFGLARILKTDSSEANTERIAGTRAYCPREYLQDGVYSKKSDVYSFGILLLQIISGKRCGSRYGPDGDMELHVYAYELWKEGRGMEIMDPSLDDSNSTCKLADCLRIALLCIQRKPMDRPSMQKVSSMLRDLYRSDSTNNAVDKNIGITDERDDPAPPYTHLDCSWCGRI